MMNNSKIKLFINFIVIPILIYIGITFFVAVLLDLVFNIKLNPVLTTAIGEIISLIILFPLFVSAKNNRNDVVCKINIKNLLYLIPIGLSLAVFSNMFLDLTNILNNDSVAKYVTESIMSLSPILIIITTVITVPLVEELVFRGFIYKTLSIIINKYLAMFISSVMFGLAHGNISQGIYAFFVGIVLCVIYEKLNNLLYTVFLHSIMNFSSVFIVNYMFKLNNKEKFFVLIISLILFIITIYRLLLVNKNTNTNYEL